MKSIIAFAFLTLITVPSFAYKEVKNAESLYSILNKVAPHLESEWSDSLSRGFDWIDLKCEVQNSERMCSGSAYEHGEFTLQGWRAAELFTALKNAGFPVSQDHQGNETLAVDLNCEKSWRYSRGVTYTYMCQATSYTLCEGSSTRWCFGQ